MSHLESAAALMGAARSSPAGARVARAVAILGLAAGALAVTSPARAQVSSEGKGVLAIEVGQGTVPFGGIATNVANPGEPEVRSSLHATAFRFMAGYHFAEQLSVEVGVAHLGSASSSAPYNGTDTLTAQASLLAVEGDLVANIPIAPRSRVDVTLGIAETGLTTNLSTVSGSSLLAGQGSSDSVRRYGFTGGFDLEWRIGEATSFVLGYHAYTHVGSPVLRDSASGTVSVLLGGLKFEF